MTPHLYLHLGWPKTGTTTLQAALAGQRDLLAATGTIYPDGWNREGDDSHNGLTELLRAGAEPGAFGEVTELLAAHPGTDVLLSSESLTTWLLREEMLETLLGMVTAMRDVVPVTVVWTLRRLDDMAHSLYVQMSLAGIESQPGAQFMERVPHARIFSGMRELERLAGDRAVYVKYDSGGAHNVELLDAFGLSREAAAAIGSQLRSSRRLNASRSHKQLVAARNVEALSARSGVELSKAALLDAFDTDGFRFEHDRPCELAGDAARSELREAALESARSCGFSPYLSFFEDEEAGEAPSARDLDPDDLSDEDLSRLISHLRAHSQL